MAGRPINVVVTRSWCWCLAFKWVGAHELQCFFCILDDSFIFFLFSGTSVIHVGFHVPVLAYYHCSWMGTPRHNFPLNCENPENKLIYECLLSTRFTARCEAMPNQTQGEKLSIWRCKSIHLTSWIGCVIAERSLGSSCRLMQCF